MIACPICEESGCDNCTDGSIEIATCPRDYIGGPMTSAINLASMCGKGTWPVAGGLLDQSAWFLDLHQTFENDTNRITTEQLEKD